jgi:hypothetical protein
MGTVDEYPNIVLMLSQSINISLPNISQISIVKISVKSWFQEYPLEKHRLFARFPEM